MVAWKILLMDYHPSKNIKNLCLVCQKTILSITVANYSILPNNINGGPKMTYAGSSIYIKTMLRLPIKGCLSHLNHLLHI